MLHTYLVPHPPLIIPGVGKGDEIPDTRRAFLEIAEEIATLSPDTVLIISPHSVMYGDYFHISPGERANGDLGAFRAGDMRFTAQYDAPLAAEIDSMAEAQGIPAGGLGERDPRLDHGVMVPLYFIKPSKILRVSLSGLSLLDHYRLGMCITEAAKTLSRKIVIIASGDMSHKLTPDGPYGFAPEGPRFDAFVCDCVRDADAARLLSVDESLSERAGECGLRALAMMFGALDGMRIKSRLLCYEGPYGVGYLTAAFRGEGENVSLLPQILADREREIEAVREGEDSYVKLARRSVETYVNTKKHASAPVDLPPEMLSDRAGVFVSIKKDGRLRGCIGTIEPVRENIADEILENGISAACRDPRFDPILPEELKSLRYSVDVLSPAEPVDDPGELDVLRYGVIVTSGKRRGLLLPNLDGVDTVEEQIDIALSKAGISPDEKYALLRFEVVRHT